MNSEDSANLLYLSVLLGAVGFYFIVANRQKMGQMIRHAALWGLIFIGLLAGAALWQDIGPRLMSNQVVRSDGALEVPRDASGHYTVFTKVNGKAVEFLVDTGASNVVLSMEDAKKAGVDLDNLSFLGRANTANGAVRTAPVWIDTLELGDFTETRVRAYVTDGDLFGSLLGMDFLQRFEKIEITGDRLILTR